MNQLKLTDIVDEPFESFKFWFVPKHGKTYDVYNLESNEVVCEYDISKDPLPEEMFGDWVKFCNRPEYSVSVFSYNTEYIDYTKLYERLLVGCSLIKVFKDDPTCNPDEKIYQTLRCLAWLKTTDFYAAPGSTRFHDSSIGGLLHHTLRVASGVTELLMLSKFSSVNLEDAVLVALLHDWCKIGLYESYKRNVKDDKTGKWSQEDAFRWREQKLTCFGHGVSSLFLAQKFFRLNLDQCLALRWHMGVWNVCDSEVNDLQQANETYPMVHLLQFADQLSIVKY